PAIDFLGGTPALEISAAGDFNDLRVEHARLQLVHSDVRFSGRLQHLSDPEQLTIDAAIENSVLSHKDVDIYVPGLGLPELDYVGTAAIRSATFSGPPDNFTATIDATTDVGSAIGGVSFDMRREPILYVADLAVIHANLGPVMKDSTYRSDFTGRLV